MAVPERVVLRAEDIFDLPDDGNRYEVIDGELYVSTAPDWAHQRAIFLLGLEIGSYVRARQLGEVASAPVGVILDLHTGVQPDLIYVSNERLSLVSKRGMYGAPDLVVEALSPSTAPTDRGEKMRAYAAAGVPHYWLVSPEAKTVEVYRLSESGYDLVRLYAAGESLRTDLFPDLEIPIDAIFAWPAPPAAL